MSYRPMFFMFFFLALSTSSEVFGNPVVERMEGAFEESATVTIKGTGFTEKENSKPLFWWNADEGQNPSSLGRTNLWGFKGFRGQITDTVTAPGSSRSAVYDHGDASAGALGRVLFDSDRVYLHRKAFDSFDITDPLHIRLKFRELAGDFKVGQTLVGENSGAKGEISELYDSGKTIVFEPGVGNIYEDPAIRFEADEVIKTSTGSAKNDFGAGDRRTFNYKTIRFWGPTKDGNRNNIWLGAQGRDGSGMRVTPEYTDNTRWTGSLVNEYHQRPEEWRHEEVVYETSDVGKRNGTWDFFFNGLTIHDESVQTRSSDHPYKYSKIFQSQVSNGAPDGSYVYYDSLYVDDSWHRILLCAEKTWDACTKNEPQIPTNWQTDMVSFVVNKGIFKNAKEGTLYLYVFNKHGEVNAKGFNVCFECPRETNLDIK